MLLLEESLITKFVDAATPGTSFPTTSEPSPVILFAKNNNSVKFSDDRELAPFPTLPNLVSVENDATLAKSATAVGYAHKRKIEQMTRCIIIKATYIIIVIILIMIIYCHHHMGVRASWASQ